MDRYLIEKMKEWLVSDSRKPLVLRGARQVGKTWIVRELAKLSGRTLVEFNFERQRDMAAHFDSNDPETILLNLQSALNQSIHPAECILFLDEIQAVPELLSKLRWFYELMPELPVIAAGSLLEFVLERHEFSMPVGRINYFHVEPLGFEEFLLAKGETHLLRAIKQVSFKASLNEALHQKASQLFQEYVMVGGMPEAVHCWVTQKSLEALAEVHSNLINTYKDDFAKYAGGITPEYLDDVLEAVPRMLTKKFIYQHVNQAARNGSIKQSVNLLTKARLCHQVHSVSANGIPVAAELNPKTFKMLLLDVGLVSTLLGLKLHQFQALEDIMVVNKGALAEQVVGQLLRLLSPHYVEPKLYYWARENSSSSAEVDYLIQNNQKIIPVEVKAGSEGKLRSLHQFMAEKPWNLALRIYTGNMMKSNINTVVGGKHVCYELVSLPMYLLGEAVRLLDEVCG